jgi:hypothetical protein
LAPLVPTPGGRVMEPNAAIPVFSAMQPETDAVQKPRQGLEADMTHAEIKSIEDAGRSTMVWSNEVYDSSNQFADIARALIPALLILTAATALLLALL